MPKMRIRLAFVALLAVAGMVACTEGKPPQSQAWRAATGAEAYERLMWKSVRDGDFKQVERHLAPIYTLTTPSGIAGRDRALEYFRSLNLADVIIGDVQVNPEGRDMVVSYRASLQKKNGTTQKYYMTTVWQQVKSGWIAIAHSEVPVGATG
jgi:Domain of unknown function (DUF4440)